MEFYTTVDDELYEELGELVGQKVVYFELWEDSLADELEADGESSEVSEEDTSFDLDLYLDDGGCGRRGWIGACFLPKEQTCALLQHWGVVIGRMG